LALDLVLSSISLVRVKGKDSRFRHRVMLEYGR
jgi:hypothetical protein